MIHPDIFLTLIGLPLNMRTCQSQPKPKLKAQSPRIPFRPRFCESWSTDYTADRFWYQDHVLGLAFVAGTVVVSRSAYVYAYVTAAP